MEHHMEILAPAGDVQGVIAAINGGADAVYFGGKHFNARQRADNFDEQEMVEMVDLCHRHGLNVYITINILVKDSEWPRVLEYLSFLDALSPDGIIVQDPGLMLILREYYPDLPLQTSTQSSVYGTEGTLFFQELGFKLVVLPREITLQEVRRIRQNVAVELKVFCHGALCYAYSGQCLFSSLVGGRSGNRGLCVQPCRKPYTLWDDGNHLIKQGYLISMKNLNTRAHLLELAEAGVDSLKIEGCMKSPEYIYAASRAYQDAASGREDTIDGQTLAQVFNRSFTTGGGGIMENSENLNPEMGENRGTPVGVVKKVRGRTAIITLLPEETLHLGDGLAFGEDGRIGQKITRMETGGGTARLPIPRGVVDGMPVFRTLDARLMAGLREKALAKLSEEKIPLSLSLTLADEKPIQVEVLARGEIYHLEIDILP
ncbi:MAG: peptidase U32 family protein, partial [Eubacterium aggregans]